MTPQASRTNGPFLQRVANLSTVLTLFSLIAIGAGAQAKLDSIDDRSVNNCRALNAGIILTLESSARGRRLTPREERSLDRTIDRFQNLQSRC